MSRAPIRASALCCLLACGSALAADPQLNCAAASAETIAASMDPASALDDLLSSGALGGKNCDTPLCKEVLKWKDDMAGAKPEELPALERQGADLLGRIYSSFNDAPDAPGITEKARKEFDAWKLKTLDASGNAIDRMPVAVWLRSQHKLFANDPNEIDFDRIYEQACSGDQVGNCADLFVNGACVLAHATLQHQVLHAFLADNRKAFGEYLTALDDRWQAYRAEGRSLYPWELALNEWLWWDYSNAAGFSEPPSSQWVVLHPDVALRYDDKTDGDRLNEAVTLEILGYDRWSYVDSGFTKWVGFSAVAAWTGEGPASWGLMTHWQPNLAVGVTYRKEGNEDQYFLLVSVDAGKLLTKAGSVREELLRSGDGRE